MDVIIRIRELPSIFSTIINIVGWMDGWNVSKQSLGVAIYNVGNVLTNESWLEWVSKQVKQW